MAFPTSVKVEEISRQHDDYRTNVERWEEIWWLYEGKFDEDEYRLEQLLVRKPKEPVEMYKARKKLVTYDNILSNGIGWYESKLFAADPEYDFLNEDAKVEMPDFYQAFIANADKANTNLTDVLKKVARHLMLHMKAVVLIDNKPVAATNLAEQDALGGRSPYCVFHDPRNLINWGVDEAGNLIWARLQYDTTANGEEFPNLPTRERHWLHFTTTEYAHYVATLDDKSKPENARLLDQGLHATSAQRRVPVLVFEAPPGLWLANRAFLPSKQHFNLENAMDWALHNGAVATLVIKSDQKIANNQTISEVGYFLLPTESSIEYLEQAGTSLSLLQARVQSLSDTAYKQMCLIHMGRSSDATPAVQSGYAKELEMMPGTDVLNGIGKIVKAAAVELLNMVAAIRLDKIRARVNGLDFGTSDPASQIQTITLTKALDVQSDTFDQELDIEAVRAQLPNHPQEVIDKIITEIRSGPTKSARAEQAKKDLAASFTSSFNQNAAA